MRDNSVVTSAGIFLPTLPYFGSCHNCIGYSLQEFITRLLESPDVSVRAKDLLRSIPPARRVNDGSSKRLIAVEGASFRRDLHTEEINRFAKEEGWTEPSLSDALRLFNVMSFRSFAPNVNSVVVLHKPIQEHVLGINNENGKLILSSYKALPRKKGWYCKDTAFVYRSE